MNQKPRFPRICSVFLVFAAISTLLYITFRANADFADWFNQNVSIWGRKLMAWMTMIFPFSFAEFLLLLIPMILVVLIVMGSRRYCDSWKATLTYIGILLSSLSLIWTIFVWNFAAGYSTPSLDRKLNLKREKVSAQELYQTASVLSDAINELAPQIVFLADGHSLMPYSYSEMNEKLLDAYDRYCEKEALMTTFDSRVKPIMLSEPMSYTHITGVYTFFTGEANINVNFPDYTIPYTAAHELAHQRGIAREDEANFVAFLVCMESDDPYIRYSAYLNVYEYVASALASADRDLYYDSYASLPAGVHAEEDAYSEFFEKYRKNVAADVSQAVNNSYLISQGSPEGTKSYNLVVDLAVAYYKAQGAIGQSVP